MLFLIVCQWASWGARTGPVQAPGILVEMNVALESLPFLAARKHPLGALSGFPRKF